MNLVIRQNIEISFIESLLIILFIRITYLLLLIYEVFSKVN